MPLAVRATALRVVAKTQGPDRGRQSATGVRVFPGRFVVPFAGSAAWDAVQRADSRVRAGTQAGGSETAARVNGPTEGAPRSPELRHVRSAQDPDGVERADSGGERPEREPKCGLGQERLEAGVETAADQASDPAGQDQRSVRRGPFPVRPAGPLVCRGDDCSRVPSTRIRRRVSAVRRRSWRRAVRRPAWESAHGGHGERRAQASARGQTHSDAVDEDRVGRWGGRGGARAASPIRGLNHPSLHCGGRLGVSVSGACRCGGRRGDGCRRGGGACSTCTRR